MIPSRRSLKDKRRRLSSALATRAQEFQAIGRRCEDLECPQIAKYLDAAAQEINHAVRLIDQAIDGNA